MGNAVAGEVDSVLEATGGGDAVVVFDTEIAFESDGTAVMWASVIDGAGVEARFALRVTREYTERAWRIRYSREGVTTKIWVHVDELRDLVAREVANGKTELVL